VQEIGNQQRKARTTSVRSDMENNIITCPFCDCDCVHMESVQVNRGGELTEIGYDGTRLRAGSPSGRGARVETTLFCEYGHKWTSVLQFHKGTLTSENHLISETSGNFCHDLWRN